MKRGKTSFATSVSNVQQRHDKKEIAGQQKCCTSRLLICSLYCTTNCFSCSSSWFLSSCSFWRTCCIATALLRIVFSLMTASNCSLYDKNSCLKARTSQAENKTLSTVIMLCKPTDICSAMRYNWSQTPNISLLYGGVRLRN
jgi:hypothetical protein